MKFLKYIYSAFLVLTLLFANQYDISIRNDSTFNVNYLIIAPDSFSTQAAQLADYRSMDNLICNIVSWDSIIINNTYSTPDSSLKEFITTVWNNNSTDLQYGVILGDWEVIMPHQFFHVYDSIRYVDQWYTTNLDSTANSIYESFFSLGRIPVESSVQLQWYINRLISYENQIQILPWQNRVLALAGDRYNINNCIFDNLSLDMGLTIEDEGLDFVIISRCEESDYYESDPSIVANRFMEGSVLTLYNGFNSNHQWENDSLFTFDNVNNLSFWDYSPIMVTSGNKQYGFRDSLSSIVKKMFVESIDGPISISSSANSLGLASNWVFNSTLVSNIVAGNNTRIGDSFNETINSMQVSGAYIYQLFGDPALMSQIIKNESQIIEPFSFELSINDQSTFVSVYPDTGWNYVEIPVSHYPSIFQDSLEFVSVNQVNITPYFVSDSARSGRIIIDEFSFGDLYFEDFDNNIDSWEVISEENSLSLDLTSETPTGSVGALELEFNRAISDTMISTIYTIFDSPIVLTSLDTIRFWIKRGEVSLEIKSPFRILPNSLLIYQNYPNPFNPTTTIQYELPQRSDVQINIYDLLGRQVASLVSETQEAGIQSIQWNATNVPSGMYFYQIRAGEFVQTRKMVLLK